MNLRVVSLNLVMGAVMLGGSGPWSVQAQTVATPSVWRCGQLLTNQPEPGQACEPLPRVDATVVEGTRVNGLRAASSSMSGTSSVGAPRERAAGASAVSGTSSASSQQARVLLQAELREQEQRWQQLQSQWNQGRPVTTPQQPEGSPAYLDRVAMLREQLQRSEADLAALRRELARLP